MNPYTLPDLPYDYGALEPHLAGRIIELHHDKHHAAYVKGANETLELLADARQRGEFAKLAALEHALAFHVSGHVLHSLYWRNLSPDGGGAPDGALAAQIATDFGGFEPFRKQLTATAMSIMGSGWAALSWDPLGQRLVATQIHDHQSEVTQAGLPLLVLDAWEHAYYLQYQTEKAKYFDAIWQLWNWPDVAARFEAARAVDVQLRGAPILGGGAPVHH